MKKVRISAPHCLHRPLSYDRPGWQTVPDRLPESQDNLGRDDPQRSSGPASAQSSAGFHISAGVAGSSCLQDLPRELQASCICIWMLPPCSVLVSSYSSWTPGFFLAFFPHPLFHCIPGRRSLFATVALSPPWCYLLLSNLFGWTPHSYYKCYFHSIPLPFFGVLPLNSV